MAGEYTDVRLGSAIEPLNAKDLRDDVLESPRELSATHRGRDGSVKSLMKGG
jgi:hypothetical protein